MRDLSIKSADAVGGTCGCGGHGASDAHGHGGAHGCGCGGHGDAKAEKAASASAASTIVAGYTVSGMTCGHCVKAVTEEVSAIPGVTGVKVDLDSGRLQVTSDAPVDFDRIVEAVAEAGDYSVA